MIRPSSPGPVVACVVVLAGVVLVVAQWQARVMRAQRVQLDGESWDHVRTQYPVAQAMPQQVELSREVFGTVVQANPFDPERRLRVAGQADGDGQGRAEVTEPPPPQFLYKGHINVGTRQRAIVEERVLRKTYFLETGQEIAGLKVLDISEDRVVLSNPTTQEEIVLSLVSGAKS